jgi:hypothetical protein
MFSNRHFSSLNQSNKSLQGPRQNVLSSSDTTFGFKMKLNIWENFVVKGNLETFLLLLKLESKEGYQHVLSLIANHLEELQNKIKHYFPSLSTQTYDSVLNPYTESSAQPENLTLRA